MMRSSGRLSTNSKVEGNEKELQSPWTPFRRTGLSRRSPRVSSTAPESKVGQTIKETDESTPMITDDETKPMVYPPHPSQSKIGEVKSVGGGVPRPTSGAGDALKNDLSAGKDPLIMTIHQMEHNQPSDVDIHCATSKQKADLAKNGQKMDVDVAQKPPENGGTKKATSRRRTTGRGAASKKKKKTAGGGGGFSKRKESWEFKPAYTNRKNIKELAKSAGNMLPIGDLSKMSTEEKLKLSSWGLPSTVVNNYHSKGITSLFQWQSDCFAGKSVWEGRNLVYSAPTSAGKTLVSEILMIRRVLELGRKAIVILPYVSVAREKVHSLQSIVNGMGVRVEGFIGSINPPGGFKDVDIAICTLEKANSLVNKLLEEDSLADLGTLVVDELHMLGDEDRCYLLELLLTKIMYMTSIKNDTGTMNVSDADTAWRSKKYPIQIIGMSATLPNVGVLASWLNAELCESEFRPVPLKMTLQIDDKLLDQGQQFLRNVYTADLPIEISGDVDNITYLALETVLDGLSVLIFCNTKTMVEKTAHKIATQFLKIGNPGSSNYPPDVVQKLRGKLNAAHIKIIHDQLKQCPGGVDETLVQTVMFGVGYHHAGLTNEARDIVESAFRGGILKVIVSTSTLAAGVNLPARRVMIATPLNGYNGSILDDKIYRQMCGRAGRTGIDTEGESILICPPNLEQQGKTLFSGSMTAVKSALWKDGTSTSQMKRAVLEAIASGIAVFPADVRSYMNCTFLFNSELSELQKNNAIKECVAYLTAKELIRIKHFEQVDRPHEYTATRLGSACLAASLPPEDGLDVHDKLWKARECFVLDNDLHVIYQVTPINLSSVGWKSEELWSNYLKIFNELTSSEKKIAGLIGITERFIIKASMMCFTWKNPTNKRVEAKTRTHLRFYAALALSDLVNENSLEFVAQKYRVNKGSLQTLQRGASMFAGMVTVFCGRLGWSNLEVLLSQFQERLEFGVQRELCDLVRLDCINGRLARILYDAGIKTLMELAASDLAQVEHVLRKATPFNSPAHSKGEISQFRVNGKNRLSESETAQKVVFEARAFIKIEVGQLSFCLDSLLLAPDKRLQLNGTVTTTINKPEEKKNEEFDNAVNGESEVNSRQGSPPVFTIGGPNIERKEDQEYEADQESLENSSDHEQLSEETLSESDNDSVECEDLNKC